MKICNDCNNTFSSNGWSCPACGNEPAVLNGLIAHAEEFAYSGGGFKSEYFAELAALEATNFWFQARNELILWSLQTYQPSADSLLEVGCGTGFVLSNIAKKHPNIDCSGSEIFLDGLLYAYKRLPTTNLFQMDARNIPFVDEFDVIGAFDVLEHIQEDENVLLQIYEALKPRGILILTVPQHPWLWSATDDYACHVRRYSYVDLKRKITEAQFTIERSTSFVSLLLPAMLLSRQKKHELTAEHNVKAELNLPKLLNKCFYATMQIEQKLIKWGISFPVGGSRLIVARKKL